MGSLKSCKHYHWLTILAILRLHWSLCWGVRRGHDHDRCYQRGHGALRPQPLHQQRTPRTRPHLSLSAEHQVKGMVDNPMTLTAEAMHAMDP